MKQSIFFQKEQVQENEKRKHAKIFPLKPTKKKISVKDLEGEAEQEDSWKEEDRVLEKPVMTFISRTNLLQITAFYLVPFTYITFTITYFITYVMY